MKLLLKVIINLLVINTVKSSIDGLTYMDLQNTKKLYNTIPKGENPCNPLYWYPRHVPDYCYFKNEPKTEKPAIEPIPMPIPVPVFPKPLAPVPILPPPPPPPIVPASLPFSFPFASPNPMMPIGAGVPYPIMPNSGPPPFLPYHTFASPFGNQQAGMVPGIRGIVTRDGGINILPFSDAYSDMLEKHKQKMIRRKLQRVLDDYEDYPKNYYRLRKRLRNVYIE